LNAETPAPQEQDQQVPQQATTTEGHQPVEGEPTPKKQAKSPGRPRKVDVSGTEDSPAAKKGSPKGVTESHSASPKSKGKQGRLPMGTAGFQLFKDECKKVEPRKLVRDIKETWDKMSEQQHQVSFEMSIVSLY
jgi:hypothetical protein